MAGRRVGGFLCNIPPPPINPRKQNDLLPGLKILKVSINVTLVARHSHVEGNCCTQKKNYELFFDPRFCFRGFRNIAGASIMTFMTRGIRGIVWSLIKSDDSFKVLANMKNLTA